MPRILTAIVAMAALLTIAFPAVASAWGGDAADCDDFDAWQWAQTVFETDPDDHATLDPNDDGIACPSLPRNGFAPVLWTDAIPASAERARIASVTDGDTFDIIVNGTPDTVRMYHINSPELGGENRAQQCGAVEATRYLTFIFALVPDQEVWLEYDETRRDRYDRRLAYVWFELNGDIYMVNEVMIRNGWAESDTYEPDDTYRDQLNEAEQFSVRHNLGVRKLCGTFGVELEPQSRVRQTSNRVKSSNGVVAAPVARNTTTGCEPAYPDVCIPPRSQVGDLDCGDISERRFRVIPPDPHNFDGNHDGVGCEGG